MAAALKEAGKKAVQAATKQAPAAAAAAAATPAAAVVKKETAAARQGKCNLFEIVTVMPKYGVGLRVARTLWRGHETYYTLTRVRPTPDMRHGDAWGLLTWRGKTDEQPTKIGGPLKKEWRFFTAPATTHDQIVEHHKLAKQAREAKAAQHAAQPAPAS